MGISNLEQTLKALRNEGRHGWRPV